MSAIRLKGAKETHDAEFRSVTEDGSEYIRVTCLETGESAKHWPSYLREGQAFTVWDDGYCECTQVNHRNVTKAKVRP